MRTLTIKGKSMSFELYSVLLVGINGLTVAALVFVPERWLEN